MLFMKGKNDASKAVATLVIVFILTSSLYVLANIPITVGSHTYDLKTFSSYEELLKFLRDANLDNVTSYYGYYRDSGFNVRLQAAGSIKSTMLERESAHFSKTNIQVDGVDEPDIVKTDGTYIYLVSGEKVYILKAYPPEKAQLLSTIAFDNTPNNIFINGNKLVVFATVYSEGKWYSPRATIYLYDVSDKSDPILIKTVSINGSYVDARMIDSYVYMIASESTWLLYCNEKLSIPTISIDNASMEIAPSSIYYVNISEPVESLIHIISLNVDSEKIKQKSFMAGYSQTVFVSRNNIYITSFTCEPGILTVGSWNREYSREEVTIIYKISISKGNIEYVAQGKVPGHVLNQFSMDEHNGYFRIATTVGNVWDGSSRNNVYILDDKLNQVGAIENIAPGEKIYSARFMGNKAYLVTFKKVDPFFTLDLSDPYHPKVLGKLKIPGYSDYLHPYDENHIIGIGKETVEALPEEKESRRLDFAWYQGLKITLFDVSDFEHPKEVAKVVIGDRGTYSPVLYDHKALLFDREKNLLVIPVTVYEINDAVKEQHGGYTGNIYGKFTFQGVYVYHINPDDGFVLKGRITHREDNESFGIYYWYWDSGTAIKRSLYIGNTLYTISDSMIKMNDLDTLEDINSIELI